MFTGNKIREQSWTLVPDFRCFYLKRKQNSSKLQLTLGAVWVIINQPEKW